MCQEVLGFCCSGENSCEALLQELMEAAIFGHFGSEMLPMHPVSKAIAGPFPEAPHATVPRKIADGMAETCQEAVRWFHEPDHVFLGDVEVRTIPDDEVRERISGYQVELDREHTRVRRQAGTDSLDETILKYELSKLPFARQRALVERWERTWTSWLDEHEGWVVTDEGFIPPSE